MRAADKHFMRQIGPGKGRQATSQRQKAEITPRLALILRKLRRWRVVLGQWLLLLERNSILRLYSTTVELVQRLVLPQF
jgi:hypothetical protein